MHDLDEAVRRGNAALEAGADMVFVEATQTLVEEMAAVPQRVKGPCLLNIVPGGRTPILDLREVEAMGYKLAILPGLMLKATYSRPDTMRHSPSSMADADAAGTFAPSVAGRSFRRFGADEWDALRTRFNAGAADRSC